MNNLNDFDKFINNLKLLYSDEVVTKIIIDQVDNFNSSKFETNTSNLSSYIYYAKKYDNENIDILNTLNWEEITDASLYNIEENILNLCFEKFYSKKILIKGHDLLDLYNEISQIEVKQQLLKIAQNNNLEFLAFILEELTKYNVKINSIEEIFKMKISDKFYDPVTKEKLGELNFIRLIVYFFDRATVSEQQMINKILEVENYELITDFLHFRAQYKFSKYIMENELENDIFSLKAIHYYDILNIIWNYISLKQRFDFKYLDNLRSHISNEKMYNNFYNKHSETLELLQSLNSDNFSKLDKEEQKKIYTYIKSLDKNKKQLLVDEIKEINTEMRNLYKVEYSETFGKSKDVISKAQLQTIKDSEENKHNINVYELKDDEPFNFLITVMHHKARLVDANMYGRPAHKLTIENPENFCKDLNGGSEIISTSMINDRFIDTFVGPYADVMYIFSDIEAEDILGICPRDGRYPPKIEETRDLFSDGKPMGPKWLMREASMNREYNEIAIRRKNKGGQRILPSAILCYDKINDTSIKHAEYFNIPIIVINTKTYRYLAGYTKTEEENKGFYL